jgi:acyl-homoserine lactone acylase PvdQ
VIGAGAVIGLLAAIGLAGYLWLLTSLPQINGTVTVNGLSAPVEIIRDENAVPHIFVGNAEDATFALGYVHAQDRLCQMEFTRRLGAGKPILANDPHLSFAAPVLWYLARIEAPGMTLTGVPFPGAPMTVLGHNGDIARLATAVSGRAHTRSSGPLAAATLASAGARRNHRRIELGHGSLALE